eukprot:gnl/Spiro4/23850_TR11807_c0_g1_i1.p1 gnl/Spiro4/23850_TR11807_c0_g1~~gnl/Spiro4/23850_TR11807_c0_g1_i1.p1  ORF type:complete len:207 (-),score=23.41 gnl/Spiro4/23850_TR11807_c0_g1_i1:156-737(-)
MLGSLLALDLQLSNELSRSYGHTSHSRLFWEAVSFSSDGVPWLVVPLVLFVFLPFIPALRLLLHPFFVHLFIVCAIGAVLDTVMKAILRRPRPPTNKNDNLTPYIGPDKFSCPSGHSSRAFAIAVTVLLHGSSPLRFLAFGWSSVVALSRIFLGRHYPSDVFVGALLGIAQVLASHALGIPQAIVGEVQSYLA